MAAPVNPVLGNQDLVLFNQNQALVNPGPEAVVDWNPEPTKALVKQVYNTGIMAAGVYARPRVIAEVERQIGPNPANPAIADRIIENVQVAAQRGTDAIADSYYATPESLGSRIARWLGFPG